ncbi:8376_t:CDS:2 [Acaulospora morrowiae]|uniref:8376_t:CDS:1 n=1 Tax=Acaulospora morrowiae TaxID=94023 RepID=A0A9N9NU11_9GLOM|nr:8376_t:CDS:2 [Acaulospora morrowiae]
MSEKLKFPPDIILTNLYTRFTETAFRKAGGVQKSKMTARYEDKLLCYMFTLCLMLDAFRVDPDSLSEDLAVTTNKVYSIFRTLGCKIEGLNKSEKEALGINGAQSKLVKRAVLNVPLVLPEPKKRKYDR